MRIQSPRKHRPPNYLARSQQWRLLLLVMGLGLVVVLMNQVRQPKMATGLQRVFAPQRRVSEADIRKLTAQASSTISGNTVLHDAFHTPRAVSPLTKKTTNYFDGVRPELLATIRDNTHFRSRETDAWFHLLGILQQATDAELTRASCGEVGYVELIEQPHVYRGQVVSVRGSVRRVETLPTAENDIGLEEYHLLTIRPIGGQIWPIRAYCLDLPADFPEGVSVAVDLIVTGFFFKNWSYSWQDGLGLAPIILARSVKWLDGERTGR